MFDYFGKLNRNIIDQIQYRGTMVTGVITADNRNGSYAVKIAQADEAYPYVETAFPDMVFGVGEVVLITFEYGNKEMPRILGHAKRIAQHPIDVESDYSGEGGDPITTVETLDPYLVAGTAAYLEGKIFLSSGTGNCIRRGFQYGLTADYGLDVHEDGSYGEGSYSKKVVELAGLTTYHFRAYVLDFDNDIKYGEDNIFTTKEAVINLISGDDIAQRIYVHVRITSSISEDFASPSTSPYGLTYDLINLISADVDSHTIYIHMGISSTISDSFSSPYGSPMGLAYDGVNLISSDSSVNRIFIHSGVTSGISSWFATPAFGCYGLTYDGNNLISCDYFDDLIYVHSRITSTIINSFASPWSDASGLAFDGTNLISCDANALMIYIHSGISSTILDSFASPASPGGPMGITKSV